LHVTQRVCLPSATSRESHVNAYGPVSVASGFGSVSTRTIALTPAVNVTETVTSPATVAPLAGEVRTTAPLVQSALTAGAVPPPAPPVRSALPAVAARSLRAASSHPAALASARTATKEDPLERANDEHGFMMNLLQCFRFAGDCGVRFGCVAAVTGTT